MAEFTRTRTREKEAAPGTKYDEAYAKRGNFVERSEAGVVVVKDSDRDWELSRQGYLKWYLLEEQYPDTVLQDWWVFIHDIRKQSGRHRHQGGLVLFIIEGKGATEVNGELIEWEEGDCVLLPMHPEGIEHVHFNREGKPAKWLAFIYIPIWDHVASELTQIDVYSEYKQSNP